MPDPPPVLVVKNLQKAFEGHPVLRGISLEARAGEFLTLLGPSGCGKTTTLRIVAGFELPDEGEVLLEGRNVAGLPPYRRDVHTVFQQYALFPHYDVFDNIAFGLRIRGVPEPELATRVNEALELVQLPGLGHRRADQLSGGQQQRVAVARALVGRPRILLLDEPLGALDLKLRKKMQLELKHIQNRLGLTFIYVTHDQEEALTMSDRIAVFNAGRIEQVGVPSEIYDKPASAFVADFIGAANLFDAKVVGADAASADVMLENEVRLRLPLPEGLRPSEGETLKVAIRPERVRVVMADRGGAADGGVIRLPCELRETVFLGSAHHLHLAPFKASPRTLVAVQGPGKNGLELGRQVYADVRTEDLLLLR